MTTKNETLGQCYLFVIAINEYQNVERLKAPLQNAQDIAQILMSKYNFLEENILSLCNKEATRENILHYLREFSTGLKEQDSLIIFYSGHGVIDEWTNEGYWIPVDASEESLGKWVSNYEVKKFTDYCRARHILILCDSFFHGDFLVTQEEKNDMENDMLTNWYVKKSRQVVYSAKTPVDSINNRSAFTNAIIEALAENKQPQLITSALFLDVCALLVDHEEAFPFIRVMNHNHNGEYFFFLAADSFKDVATSQQIHTTNKEIGNIEKKIGVIEERELPRIKSHISNVQDIDNENDEVDNVIKIFKEKEKVESELLELREIKSKLHKENSSRLKRIENQKIEDVQKRLTHEVEKYNLFISSKLCNEDIKNKAWGLVLRQCPEWWQAKEVSPHDVDMLMLPPEERKSKNLHSDILGSGFKFIQKQTYNCGDVLFKIDEFEHSATGISFSLIPGGNFIMGGEKYDWEKPMRTVTIRPFLISKHLISQEMWEKVMGNNPSFFKGDKRPVESVSWEICQEFCQKYDFKLPTESQWEYATRGGSSYEYYWGNRIDDAYCWYGDNSGGQTHDIGEKKPNAFGLYDTLGNVWEWCLDTWHPDYNDAPQTDKAWIDDEFPSTRVIRGGSYYYIADFCRSAYRGRIAANRGNRFSGFRVVKNLL
ncbi:SUMF1/EgtB/PvdO family nonheme iron enzyme [Candidatus Uabimicrobium sp. HlEnr_7]|uniref:SUMF1/EgtB/PvdO family nonheme iron enzyme n=1 Tax=Candidatus Uabimicrobium helgolandensis TaxID=3095367 RepID=UPI00355731F6